MHKQKKLIGLLFSVALATQALHAVSYNYFATPDGSGDDCSQDLPCSLSTVLTKSLPNNIYLGAGTYTGSGTDRIMTLNTHVNILGGWDATSTTPVVRDSDLYVSVIDGEGERGCILIDEDKVVTIDGVSIINCQQDSSGAGLYVINSRSLELKDVNFSRNYSSAEYGGGAYIKNGTVEIENCTFTQNSANRDGGALYIKEANATVKSSTFQENDANYASALYFDGKIERNALNISDSNFTDNSKKTSVSLDGGQHQTIAINDADANITNNIFKNNTDLMGTPIYIHLSNFYFINNIVINNEADLATLYVYNSQFAIIVNSVFADNNASRSSGNAAIHFQDVRGAVAYNTIANNDVNSSIRIGAKGSDDNFDMFANIITGHKVGIVVESDSTLRLSYTLWGEGDSANDINISSTSTTSTQEDDFAGDPAFIDEANGDYHIGIHSAARDKCTFISEIEFDMDYDKRPFGSGSDIGADEFSDILASPAITMYLLN